MAVCRLWHDLVLRTPAVWAIPLLPVTIDLVGLLRSGPTPQQTLERLEHHLSLTGIHPLILTTEGFPAQAVQIFAAHVNHITSLTVDLGGSSSSLDVFLNSFLAGPLPVLDNLTVSYHTSHLNTRHPGLARIGKGEYSMPLPLSRTLHPRLRSLTIPRTFTNLGDIGGQLEHLSLNASGWCGLCAYTAKDLQTLTHVVLGLLKGCSSLNSLHLEWLCSSDTELRAPAMRSVVHLPQLQKLYVLDSYAPAIATFLSCLSYPTTCFVEPTMSDSGEYRIHLPENLSAFPPVSNADNVEFELTPQRSRLVTRANGVKTMQMEMDTIRSEHYFRVFHTDLLMFAPFGTLTALTLSAFAIPENDMWIVTSSAGNVLDGLPQLRRLELFALDAVHDLVPLLGGSGKRRPAHCRCPQLEELRLRWYPTVYGPRRQQANRPTAQSKPHDTAEKGDESPSQSKSPNAHLEAFCESVAAIIEWRSGQEEDLGPGSKRGRARPDAPSAKAATQAGHGGARRAVPLQVLAISAVITFATLESATIGARAVEKARGRVCARVEQQMRAKLEKLVGRIIVAPDSEEPTQD
ncbi:hypothetical protein C8Q80DRAFT_1276005 [Daedaleopsis nitida]|nr:hypothetical protein C8Q80DRAFT_1276005 [Daedaleopsis nitida]